MIFFNSVLNYHETQIRALFISLVAEELQI